MAQTRTAKGTMSAKTSLTASTAWQSGDISMVGGDLIQVAVCWNTNESANPDVVFGGNADLDAVGGETMAVNSWRCRIYERIVNNSRTAKINITWPSAVTARVAVIVSLHSAGKSVHKAGEDEDINLSNTISISGAFRPIEHIQTIVMAYHLSNGPAGDSIGSSSTGFTLGQRVGTTGDADTTNITLQETYKIIAASTVAAGSFVIGDTYQIKTIGTTDFTAIGAASNTVGVQFVATGVGSGTGDAYDMEEARSRLTGLTSRDQLGIMAFMEPKQTFTIKSMVQVHRLMNHNPDWVEVEVEDEAGDGFRFRIDPDFFDDWSDAAVAEYVSKMCSIWVTNNIDDNLTYEADTTRDTRMATFVNDQVIL